MVARPLPLSGSCAAERDGRPSFREARRLGLSKGVGSGVEADFLSRAPTD